MLTVANMMKIFQPRLVTMSGVTFDTTKSVDDMSELWGEMQDVDTYSRATGKPRQSPDRNALSW